MVVPDRVPVAQALGVVPHPVGVDDRAAGGLGDRRASGRRRGRARRRPSCFGGVAEPLRPGLADQVVVAADAAAGDDDGLRARARSRRPRSRLDGRAARHVARARGRAPRTPATAPPVDDQLVDPVPEREASTRPLRRCSRDPPLERLDHPGAGAPGDVEARHRVAVPVGAAVAALGPADDREEPVPLLAQPGPLLAGGEVDVRLGPARAASGPRRGRTARCRASPAGPARRESLMPIRRCSGLSTRNSPPSDQNAWPPRTARAPGRARARPARVGHFAAAARPASPAPITTTSAGSIVMTAS